MINLIIEMKIFFIVCVLLCIRYLFSSVNSTDGKLLLKYIKKVLVVLCFYQNKKMEKPKYM